MPIYTGNTTVNSAITSTSLTEMTPQSFQITNALRNTVRPTLLLPFNESTTVDTRITFTRASSATYFNNLGVITTAAANVPRIDYNPSTGACLGLLIEQSSTNLITYSGDVSTFGATFSTLTANSATSPDGTTTAALMIPSVDLNNNHYISKVWNGSVGNSVTFTISIFAKTAGYQWIRMNTGNAMGGGYLFFDIINGVIGAYATVTNPTIQACGNGWFRCSYQFTTAATGTGAIGHQIYGSPSNGNFASWSGNGTSGYYFWGAQVEQLAFLTSYIPTVASTATRSADLAIISGTNFSSWYNTTAATVMAEVTQESSSGGIQLQFSDNNTNKLNMSTNSTTVAFYDYYSVSSTLDVSISATYSGSSFKSIGAISGALSTTGTIALVVNGGTAVTGTTGNYSGAAFTQLALGYALGGTYLNGWIQRIAYWPIAMTNTQLQAMSS